MQHDTTLIATIAMGLVLAFGFVFLASRLRLPPLVGYLLAGVAVGPHTPGFVADARPGRHTAGRAARSGSADGTATAIGAMIAHLCGLVVEDLVTVAAAPRPTARNWLRTAGNCVLIG